MEQKDLLGKLLGAKAVSYERAVEAVVPWYADMLSAISQTHPLKSYTTDEACGKALRKRVERAAEYYAVCQGVGIAFGVDSSLVDADVIRMYKAALDSIGAEGTGKIKRP